MQSFTKSFLVVLLFLIGGFLFVFTVLKPKFNKDLVYTDSVSDIRTNNRQPTMDQFIGINAFHDDPIELQKVAGSVREYHNWSWNDRPVYKGGKPIVSSFPENKLVFNLWNGAWDFDNYYRVLNENGVLVVPCLKGSLKSLNNNYGKPVPPNKSTTDPTNYAAHADYLFQYVARYGSNSKIDHAKLKVREDVNQATIAGLNYIKYYENWNEPNAWWLGKHWEFSAEEFAAMCSADYDGHMGTMGENVGLKNADPEAKLVMGGIISLDLDYLKRMEKWSIEHRNGTLPFDVINLHHYSFQESYGKSRIGISPEDDKFKEKILDFVKYRDTTCPDKEIWVTEFGYDTHPESPQRAPIIGDLSQEEVQARWLVRSYLLLASTGIERAFMYMLRDAGKGGGKYSTSGLVGIKGDWTPKISWFYVYTLKNALYKMKFFKEIESGNKNIMIYEFRHIENNKSAHAIWAKTSKDLIIENYQFTLVDKRINSVHGLEFENKSIKGRPFSVQITDNYITLDVSERPKILFIE